MRDAVCPTEVGSLLAMITKRFKRKDAETAKSRKVREGFFDVWKNGRVLRFSVFRVGGVDVSSATCAGICCGSGERPESLLE